MDKIQECIHFLDYEIDTSKARQKEESNCFDGVKVGFIERHELLEGHIRFCEHIKEILTRDENKLPEYAMGGIVNQGSFLTHPSSDIEIVEPSNLKYNQKIIEAIRKAVKDSIAENIRGE